MWLAILAFIAIVLTIVGLVWGTLWLAIPMLLVALIAGAFMLVAAKAPGDAAEGSGSEGPSQPDQPEDPAGTHGTEATGHAHEGQARMTPGQ